VLKNRKAIYAAAAALVLLFAFVAPSSLTRRGKGAVRSATAPAERGAATLWRRLAEASAVIRGIGGAVERNRELSQELVRVQTELSGLRDAENDNVRLRRAFDFSRQAPFALIPCEVVSRNIDGWWGTVRIGKGSTAGIEPNRAVVSPDGLVGRTAEVAPLSSEVLLLSDPGCRVSAKILRVEVFGLVRGVGTNLRGEPRARIDFINKDVDIHANDEVVTSGLGAFPKGVHIGYVSAVHRDESGLYQYAEIIPRATAGLLDYLFVVTDAGKEPAP